MIDIILPFFNQTELLNNCIKSIRQHTTNYNLILIDNGSTEKIKEVCIRNESNLGYPKAINQGLKQSTADFVLLLNSDTEVCENWTDLLKAPFNDDKTVGAVGPLSTAKTQWQGLLKVENKWEKVKQPLSFFCVMFSKEAINTVGYLDEDFGIGFGEDNDYCSRLMWHGYSVVIQRRLRIKHHHRQTFKSIMNDREINKQLRKADKIWREKMKDIEFTGERVVPNKMLQRPDLLRDHINRYSFALPHCVNKIVCDLGCGTGCGAFLLSMVAKEVVGVDIDEKTIQYAEQRFGGGDNLTYQVLNLETDDIPEADIYTCFEVFEHLSDPHIVRDRLSNTVIWSLPILHRGKFHKHVFTLVQAEKFMEGIIKWQDKETGAIVDRKKCHGKHVVGVSNVDPYRNNS